ncbi:hypothetical protein IU433_19420 [Nocardia puris]|uniref:Low molecular weight antigen MTB12-like C-terminal domain-containing protein n=1 Tax=Nocardia puris TaxID=208602 RepID=A0A366E2P6_9NOCA|nr:hypothetical protein [Nocardia puris]MBF6212616.1 hypothetical protein [Nocardia puris]MBF6369196.1 hypothetical protein [Nocardia puris]MBF6461205.1 hypothetical protein [Nocardia puris]RBO96567.1 hypothetical protein DFR74_101582 [Nocardia puris]
MKNRSIRAAIALVATASALALGACSSSDDDSSTGSAATTSPAGQFEEGKSEEATVEGEAPATTTPPNLPKPTVEELNERINKAFDPSVGTEEKISWIQDAERDPQLVDKLVEAAKQNDVTVQITNVGDPSEGKLKADADVTIGGQPVENSFVEFVAEGDTWKVSHQFTCNIVRAAKLDSAACQAQ